MLIRKLFRFENAHIVRNCSSQRCSHSIHGHSYQVEIILEAHALDNGHMVYDFGLLKTHIKDVIDSFDHAITFWNKDDAQYVAYCQKFSARWISLPVSPSAEQFSRVFFVLVDAMLKHTIMQNGEADVVLHSIIVHETQTGYAQCFKADIENPRMGRIELANIVFSKQICTEWRDATMYEKLKQGEAFINPVVSLQVPL